MEPTTQGTATGMFGSSQQDDTSTQIQNQTQGTATGMFGSSQQDDTSTQIQDNTQAVPAPTFVSSFSDNISIQNQTDNTIVAVETTPVAEVAVETTPVAEVAVETTPVAEVAVETTPVAEVAVETTPVAEVAVETTPVAEVAVETTPVAEVAVETTPVAEVAVETTPVAEVAVETTPVAEVAVETTPVAEVAVETTPVAEVAVETTPVAEVAVETTPVPLKILTANQEEQIIAQSQAPVTGSAVKGIETLKEAPEFKGIDIDAIIAHTDPTGTGVTITNSSSNTQIPTSSAFKKMAAIGGGLFVLAGVGLYVFSTMFSGGTITTDGIQADVQQTQDTITGINDTGLNTTIDQTGQDNTIPTDTSNTTTTENTTTDNTTTQVSTTTQPSFGAVNDSGSTTDLIEQVGEPSNTLVDTVGHITSINEKLSIAQALIKDATDAKQDDAVKYATFAVVKYKEIKQKLENGGYSSNKDVDDMISKIDQFYNKAIDIMNK